MVFLDSYRTFLGLTSAPCTDLPCHLIQDLCILSTDELLIRPVSNFYDIDIRQSNRYTNGALMLDRRIMGDYNELLFPGQGLWFRKGKTRVTGVSLGYGFTVFNFSLNRAKNHYVIFECNDIPLFQYCHLGWYGSLDLAWVYYIGSILVVYLISIDSPDLKIFLFFSTLTGSLVSWCCDGECEDIATPDLAVRAKFKMFRGQ